MDSYFIRNQHWAGALFLVLLLEPFRCGMPTTSAIAARFPPAIIITEGKANQGFPYLFGGVGSDEREAMEARAKGYNVKLIFAEKRGAFISGVIVELATAKGTEIVSLVTEGPWFYIQLPSGDYSVKATFKGATRQIKDLKVVKDKSVQQSLIWDLGEPSSRE
jgi:hypothetical protein